MKLKLKQITWWNGSKIQQKTVEIGKIDILIYKYMAAQFSGLEQSLQYKVERLNKFYRPKHPLIVK